MGATIITTDDVVKAIPQAVGGVPQVTAPKPEITPQGMLGGGNNLLQDMNQLLRGANELISNIRALREGSNTLKSNISSQKEYQQQQTVNGGAPMQTNTTSTTNTTSNITPEMFGAEIDYNKLFGLIDTFITERVEPFKDKNLGELIGQYEMFKPLAQNKIKEWLEANKDGLMVVKLK